MHTFQSLSVTAAPSQSQTQSPPASQTAAPVLHSFSAVPVGAPVQRTFDRVLGADDLRHKIIGHLDPVSVARLGEASRVHSEAVFSAGTDAARERALEASAADPFGAEHVRELAAVGGLGRARATAREIELRRRG